MAVDILMQRIAAVFEKELSEQARAALLNPKTDKDLGFAYGEACGFQKGMTHALNLVQKTLSDEDKRNERPGDPENW